MTRRRLPTMTDTPSSTPGAIEFQGVSYTYPGASGPAIENVTLRVERGERLGVLGPNGGGKSTLLKIAMGLLTDYRGRATVLGEHPAVARRHGRIATVLQKCEAALNFPLSVRQVVELGAARGVPNWRRPGRDVRERVGRSLEMVGMGALAERPIGAISGGQLQRVLIARAIASRPAILALDEPTVGIDIEGQARFAELLDSLHKELELTIVIVSHDVRAIAAGCDRVACLARTIHFHAAPQGLTPQVLAEVFQHDVAGVFGEVHVEAHRAEECPGGHAHEHGGGPA